MRLIVCLFIPLILSACSKLATDSIVTSEDIYAYMDFKTETLNDGATSDTVTIKLESSGHSIEVSTVKLDGTTMTFGSNGYQSTTTINEGDTFDVDCYLNQFDIIYNESVEDSKITIKSLPEFKIKVADQLSNLKSADAVNTVTSIQKTKVIGIIFENDEAYQVTAKASVQNTNENQSSGDFPIEDGGFINSSLLNGAAVGFVPNKLILDVSFYYDGALNAAFKGGYIRRTVQIKKEMVITN
jgi:hypothetical protein